MRITSKGQVTIPQNLREQFCFFPSTEVEFVPIKAGILITKAKKKSRSFGNKLISHMRGRADVEMTTDEIMALTRGDDAVSR